MRVVRAVRAGEAKLRGRMTSDVPIAGPPGCWDRRGSALPFALFLLLFAWVLRGFGWFLCARACFLLLFAWVLRGCVHFTKCF